MIWVPKDQTTYLTIYIIEAIVAHVARTTEIRETCNQVGASLIGAHIVEEPGSVEHLRNERKFCN